MVSPPSLYCWHNNSVQGMEAPGPKHPIQTLLPFPLHSLAIGQDKPSPPSIGISELLVLKLWMKGTADRKTAVENYHSCLKKQHQDYLEYRIVGGYGQAIVVAEGQRGHPGLWCMVGCSSIDAVVSTAVSVCQQSALCQVVHLQPVTSRASHSLHTPLACLPGAGATW